MKNTLYDVGDTMRLPKHVQLERIRRVMDEELTELQRQTLTDYYFGGLNIAEIAARRGVCKSTVSRTLHRAENTLRRFLRY